MDRSQTTNRPRAILTVAQPVELVGGRDAYDLLTEHFAAMSNVSPDNYEAALKRAKLNGPGTRKRIAELYQALRDHGYYPAYINAEGKLVCRVMAMSHVQEELERNADHYLKRGMEHAEARGGGMGSFLNRMLRRHEVRTEPQGMEGI